MCLPLWLLLLLAGQYLGSLPLDTMRPADMDEVTCARFSKDSKLLHTGSSSSCIYTWDLKQQVHPWLCSWGVRAPALSVPAGAPLALHGGDTRTRAEHASRRALGSAHGGHACVWCVRGCASTLQCTAARCGVPAGAPGGSAWRSGPPHPMTCTACPARMRGACCSCALAELCPEGQRGTCQGQCAHPAARAA